MPAIRVFLVDDRALLRTGLRLLLADQPGLRVVGEANDGRELLAQLPTTPANVVLLDLNMPGMGGVETTHQLRAHYPTVQVLALSMLDAPGYIFQMLDAGACGYVLKNAGLDEIVHGIRMVAAGRLFLCSEVGLTALQHLRGSTANHLGIGESSALGQLSGLSKRETEVLQLIAEGFTNQQIADRIFTSKRTVETHRRNIIDKTHMKNTASLIRFAMREGLVT